MLSLYKIVTLEPYIYIYIYSQSSGSQSARCAEAPIFDLLSPSKHGSQTARQISYNCDTSQLEHKPLNLSLRSHVFTRPTQISSKRFYNTRRVSDKSFYRTEKYVTHATAKLDASNYKLLAMTMTHTSSRHRTVESLRPPPLSGTASTEMSSLSLPCIHQGRMKKGGATKSMRRRQVMGSSSTSFSPSILDKMKEVIMNAINVFLWKDSLFAMCENLFKRVCVGVQERKREMERSPETKAKRK